VGLSLARAPHQWGLVVGDLGVVNQSLGVGVCLDLLMNGMRLRGIGLVLLLVAGGASAQSAESLAQWHRARCYGAAAIESFVSMPDVVRLESGTFRTSVPFGGKLYAPTSAGKILVISGSEIESELKPAVRASVTLSDIAVNDELVVVGTSDKWLMAFDRANGKQRWKFHAGGSIREASLLVGGRVYVPSDDGRLTALDSSGKQKWFVRLKGKPYAAAYDSGVIFVGSDESGTMAVDAETGKPIWSSDVGGRRPCVGNGMIFVMNRNGAAIALDEKTGAERWRYDLNATPAAFDLAVSDSAVVYSVDDTATVFDAKTGQVRWTVGLSRPICGSPIIVGDMVYIPCSDFKLHGYMTSFGAEMCNCNIGFTPWASPVYGDGKIYFPNKETMFMLGAKE
jgi:outer membrane protein assembly factor BamB